MPHIVSNFLNGNFFEKLIFWILLKPKSLLKPNETIAINIRNDSWKRNFYSITLLEI